MNHNVTTTPLLCNLCMLPPLHFRSRQRQRSDFILFNHTTRRVEDTVAVKIERTECHHSPQWTALLTSADFPTKAPLRLNAACGVPLCRTRAALMRLSVIGERPKQVNMATRRTLWFDPSTLRQFFDNSLPRN